MSNKTKQNTTNPLWCMATIKLKRQVDKQVRFPSSTRPATSRKLYTKSRLNSRQLCKTRRLFHSAGRQGVTMG
jgi:hypothetical protein